jgi:hypothetical protein
LEWHLGLLLLAAGLLAWAVADRLLVLAARHLEQDVGLPWGLGHCLGQPQRLLEQLLQLTCLQVSWPGMMVPLSR